MKPNAGTPNLAKSRLGHEPTALLIGITHVVSGLTGLSSLFQWKWISEVKCGQDVDLLIQGTCEGYKLAGQGTVPEN